MSERFGDDVPTEDAPLWPSSVWYSLSALCFGADQLTKLAIVHSFAYDARVEITTFLNLVYALNPGAAFGFLSTAGGWQRYVLIAFGVLVSIWLMRQLHHPIQRLEAFGYSLVLGGAMGNVTDRIVRGQVVDFIDFHWSGVHWPAFNLADVSIALGVGCLAVHGVRSWVARPR